MKRIVLLTLLALTAAPAAFAKLPFVEDNYTKALATAKAQHVPIFVEAWAPW